MRRSGAQFAAVLCRMAANVPRRIMPGTMFDMYSASPLVRIATRAAEQRVKDVDRSVGGCQVVVDI